MKMIDTEGLDEEIRCTMCTNRMRSDRGCDGNCQYDIHMYERIMSVLEKRIKWLLSAQSCEDTISRQMAIDSIQYAGKIGKLTCIDILKRLPSAQPES